MSVSETLPRPLRSALYLPANRAGAVAKAREADCDAVILDLEDAVSPDAKEDARAAAVETVRAGNFGKRLLVVRANALDTEWGAHDLAALAECAPDAVLLPKVSGEGALRDARIRLPDIIELWAMVETCAAFLDLDRIAHAGREDHGLTTFVLGTNDLAVEMRCTLDAGRSAMTPLLTQAVVVARAHGLAVLDGVFNDLADQDGFTRQCAQGAMLGFDGKTVIHPKQLAAANAAYGPSAGDMERAEAIAKAFAHPEHAGKGAIKVGGRMVELLHLREAERTLAVAAAIAAKGG